MILNRLMLAVAAVLMFAAHANADVLAEWDGLAGDFQAASFEGPGLSGINLTRGPGINPAAGDNFNSNNFTLNGSLLDAINNGDYLSFGMSVDSGNTLDIDEIRVELDRSATGPPTVNLFSSITGFNALDSLATQSVPTTGAILTFDLTGVGALQGVSGNVEFRFVFQGATSTAGTSDIEDDLIGGNSGQVGLQINGTSAIPEPASFAMLGFAAVGGLVLVRRRR